MVILNLFPGHRHGMPRFPGGLETINASLHFSKKNLNTLGIYCSVDLYEVYQDWDRTRDGGSIYRSAEY